MPTATTKRIRAFTIEGVRVDLFVTDCANCGVVFAMTEEFEERRRDDHRTWYCPNGHPLVFKGKSDADRERERAEAAERELAFARRQRDSARAEGEHERRRAAAARGQVTRIRNRIKAGICPVQSCRANLGDRVRDHLRTEHPDFAAPTEADA